MRNLGTETAGRWSDRETQKDKEGSREKGVREGQIKGKRNISVYVDVQFVPKDTFLNQSNSLETTAMVTQTIILCNL